MPSRYYKQKFSFREFLNLFESGHKNQRYRIDFDEGEVYSLKTEKKIRRDYNGREREYPRVRLYLAPKKICLSLHVVVWMVGAKRKVPKGFTVHHRNGDPEDCSWPNVICIHNSDNHKLKGEGNGSVFDDEVPF